MSTRRAAHAAAAKHAQSDSSEGFDPATGLALTPRLAVRLREVSSRGLGPLLLGTLRLANADALAQHADWLPLRALLGCADALRAALPFVHMLARTGEAEIAFLLPNPSDDPEALIEALVGRVAKQIRDDAGLNFPLPLEVAFGSAQGPRDGADAAVLLRQARVARWRVGASSSA